jgi:hypothetical protein
MILVEKDQRYLYNYKIDMHCIFFTIVNRQWYSDGDKHATGPYFLHHSGHLGMVFVSKPLNEVIL